MKKKLIIVLGLVAAVAAGMYLYKKNKEKNLTPEVSGCCGK